MSWQHALKHLVTKPRELFEMLELDQHHLPKAEEVAKGFPLRVPRAFVAKMKKGDFHDPLLRQVLPLDQELKVISGFSQDPLGEKTKNPLPGLLHKYHGRVLLTLSGACAIHCRYCFRRHFPYEENNPGKKGWEKVFDYLKNDFTISEVILSGGDPLVVSDEYLAEFIEKLAMIPHVQTLRIHTRLPVVIPERITPTLITALTSSRLLPVFVLHLNHAQELDLVLQDNLSCLAAAGVLLLNQSVLLKGVNDSVEALEDLSRSLFKARVLPYYLHCLDPVQGAAHFEIPEAEAISLMQQLRERLPGYLVPRLVRERAGERSKLPVESE